MGFADSCRFVVLAVFALWSACVPPCITAATAPAAETIVVDVNAPTKPFPHYWERMFGSGRAILTLRESYQNDLRAVKQITGFEYVRFHAIFHDEIGVYDEQAPGQPVYNFSYVDQVYDGLLADGVRPFIELSFMPRKLAADPGATFPFWYKQIVSPPKDWDRWEELIERFAQHLVERYGIQEVSRWYFEVWNEPNIGFWAGEPKFETYCKLYARAARALKRVSPRLRVGGPATAQAAWVDRFIAHCIQNQLPLDFVSTHVYGNDSGRDVFGSDDPVPRTEMVCRAVKKVQDEVKASPRPALPIIWSEFNASYMNEPGVTDAPFMGPWLADTIRQCDGLVDMLAYWTFSDVFEEQGVVKEPFYGGFGLIAAGAIPKPSFNAFALLHKLGTQRLMVKSESALLTRRDDGSLIIAVWNLALPGDAGAARNVTLTFKGLAGSHTVKVYRLDPWHGSPLPTYEKMGRPPYPTRQQIEELRRAAAVPQPEARPLIGPSITLMLPAHSVCLLEIH